MSAQEIANGVSDKLYSDGQVDYIVLIEGSNFISTFVNTALTFIVALLVVSLQLIIALELAYINLAGVSVVLDKISGGTSRASKFCNWTLRDAKIALERSTVNESNVNLEYIKIKWKTILIIVFVLLVVIGRGTWFIGVIKRLVSGPLTMFRDAFL